MIFKTKARVIHIFIECLKNYYYYIHAYNDTTRMKLANQKFNNVQCAIEKKKLEVVFISFLH